MESPLAAQERHQFSDRLKQALKEASVSLSPKKITEAFNLRADGATVTTHAVRKWLVGDAIPTHERLLILSTWLGVQASWLLYGEGDSDLGPAPAPLSLQTSELSLLRDFNSLSPEGQSTVGDIVKLLLATSLARKTE